MAVTKMYMNGEPFIKARETEGISYVMPIKATLRDGGGIPYFEADTNVVSSYQADGEQQISIKGITFENYDTGSITGYDGKVYSGDNIPCLIPNGEVKHQMYQQQQLATSPIPIREFKNIIWGGKKPRYILIYRCFCRFIRKVAKMAVEKIAMNGLIFVKRLIGSTATLAKQCDAYDDPSHVTGEYNDTHNILLAGTYNISGYYSFKSGSEKIEAYYLTSSTANAKNQWVNATNVQVNRGGKASSCLLLQHFAVFITSLFNGKRGAVLC